MLSRSEMSLRTLAYYQKQGGVFSEIITVLMKLRDDPATSRVLAPNRVLNEASWLFETNAMLVDPDDSERLFNSEWEDVKMDYNPKDCALIKCVLFIMLNHPHNGKEALACPQMEGVIQPMTLNSITLCKILDEEVTNEKCFFPKFKHLMNPEYLVIGGSVRDEVADKYMSMQSELVSARFRIEELENSLKEQREIGLVKDAEINQLVNDLAEARNTIANIPTQSELDSSITFQRIIDYIKSCKQYKYTNQIFMLLNWLMRNRATDEEYQLLDETQQYMQSQKAGDTTTIINNDNKNCNVINEAHDPVFDSPLPDDNE